ncbi:MAG TPA: WecB/TagA/CpsF family glycosyltransferase [Bryobacteraceae bacterium]|nr:WecB/TagA/CpsF family glycosyltransferase [Bryobacteraceae bacterium]
MNAFRESRRILNTRVDATTYEQATRQILEWAGQERSCYVCCAAVNNIMEAYDSAEFGRVMERAALVTSDGMPLVWLLRRLGLPAATRVYGPDLMRRILAAAETERIPVGFYGGSEAVLLALAAKVKSWHPGLCVSYAESPPFRPPTAEEDDRTVQAIRDAHPRILFIGLSTPKQDRWMHAHLGRVGAVMLGVGAAFDFLAGAKPQAPEWMQRIGLEWLFRLCTEPRRLSRRYLRQNPRFIALAFAQILRVRFP